MELIYDPLVMGIIITGLTEIWTKYIIPKFASEDMAKFWAIAFVAGLSLIGAIIAYYGSNNVENWEEIVTAFMTIAGSATVYFQWIVKTLIYPLIGKK